MAVKATPEQQRKLLDVQSLDDQLVRVRTQIDDIRHDQQLTTLRHDGAAAVERTKAAQARVEENQAALQQAEHAVEKTVNRRDSMQSRMDADQVPTRDTHAVTLEIAELTLRIETLEEAQLDAIQQLEDSQAALQLAEDQVAEAQQAVNVRITTLNEQGQQLSKQGKELTAERALIVEELPTELVSEYDQIRARNQGIGVMELAPEGLSGAGLPIAPAELAAIRQTPADELAFCPDTGAILVRT